MPKRNLKFKASIIFIIVISLLLCSCGKSNDLPDGAEYLVPIWYENLSEYCTGNHNNMYDFKNGYAVVSFAQMGEYWSMSNESSAIIDKNGQIVLGPLNGDLSINIIDDNNFYIGDDDNLTSKIVDINNNIISSFDGTLSGGQGDYGEELFNSDEISFLYHTDVVSLRPYETRVMCGLAKKTGQVIVPCKYGRRISNITDNHLVFLNDEEGKNADIYNPNGSFSHSVYSDYKIEGYNYGLLKISSDDGYGVADIYGNIIVNPDNEKVEIISDKHIFVSKEILKNCQLLNSEGKMLKNFELGLDRVSRMNDDIFMLSDFRNTYLMTFEGDILKEYADTRYPVYCGDGIFSIRCGKSYDSYLQLIDGVTGNFVGEKYSDKNDIKFSDGYAVVEDLNRNTFVIDKNSNKYCEEYNISGMVSDGVVKIFSDTSVGIICLPPIDKN